MIPAPALAFERKKRGRPFGSKNKNSPSASSAEFAARNAEAAEMKRQYAQKRAEEIARDVSAAAAAGKRAAVESEMAKERERESERGATGEKEARDRQGGQERGNAIVPPERENVVLSQDAINIALRVLLKLKEEMDSKPKDYPGRISCHFTYASNLLGISHTSLRELWKVWEAKQFLAPPESLLGAKRKRRSVKKKTPVSANPHAATEGEESIAAAAVVV